MKKLKVANVIILILALSALSALALYFSWAPARADEEDLNVESVTPEQVKAEFMHAWNGYKKYAWGADALMPLSKKPRNWYRESLLMTPVDALDTMLIMGLTAEAALDKKLIFDRLSFDQDFEVQHFEISIRLLGGLISAYELDGDKRLLDLAKDLADRMAPVFNSPTGMPYRFVNLKTGKTRGRLTGPAEIGTYILEYGALSKLTGDPAYYQRAKKALAALYGRRSKQGLVGAMIDVDTGVWLVPDSSIAGGIDSYYEYLLKGAILFDDPDLKAMWLESIKAINGHLADEVNGALWYGHANMNSGKRTATAFGALDAFFPAVLALGGDLDRAGRLEDSCYKMWTLHGIEPEMLDYKNMKVLFGPYQLRPEIIESAYYLYHYTGDEKYRRMGYVYFNSLVKYCRTPAGYAALADVRAKTQADSMESYFFAETLKYFYLLFSAPDVLPFDQIIFNTEAHPLKKL